MKTLAGIVLTLSLVLNAALVALLFAGRQSTAPATVMPPVVSTPAAPSAPSIDGATWTNLRSGELPALVTRLRDAGFPPDTIRAILAAHLRELYASRIKAIDPHADNRPYWKAYSIDPRVQTAQMQLYREQQKVLRSLLGADADPRDNVNALFQGRRFDSVPAEKVADVQQILRDFEDARQDTYSSASGGMIGAEIQKRLAALEKDQHAALARVLTPQELEDWDIRNSETARSLRSQLAAFNPTEQEFRTLYKLQAEFDERFGRMYSLPSLEEQQRRGEAQRQLNEQIKAALGPARATDYERSNDYSYRQTSALVSRLELPPETTNRVYEVQRDIQGKARDLFRGGGTPPERHAELNALAAEAQTRVTAILGARGYEAYQQYGGSWLQALRQPPAGSTPPPRR